MTDHRNLEHLRSAKRLTPRQARWALFFTRFHFRVTYRPGSKNGKADALSRIHRPDSPPKTSEPILPSQFMVAPIQWALEDEIATANTSDPAPANCPPRRLFVPTALRNRLLHSAHTSLGMGHPGITQTISLLQERYWWPRMAVEVTNYVKSCPDCARSKVPRHLPSGKLIPLPIPQRPWSHLGVDFLTDLPESDGFTCVLVIVDRFSKACRLVPLKGLPTALETAETLFHHVFRNFGLPEEIVSDWVWRAFMKILGVTVNLTLGYHPQSNGQTERKIQEICRFLCTFCRWKPDNLAPIPSLGGVCPELLETRSPQVSHPFNVFLAINPHYFHY